MTLAATLHVCHAKILLLWERIYKVSKFVFSIQGLVSESRSFDRATQHNY